MCWFFGWRHSQIPLVIDWLFSRKEARLRVTKYTA